MLEAILFGRIQVLKLFLEIWVLSTVFVNGRYEALASTDDVVEIESFRVNLLFEVLLGEAVDFLFCSLLLSHTLEWCRIIAA